jgi:hypothetical protein
VSPARASRASRGARGLWAPPLATPACPPPRVGTEVLSLTDSQPWRSESLQSSHGTWAEQRIGGQIEGQTPKGSSILHGGFGSIPRLIPEDFSLDFGCNSRRRTYQRPTPRRFRPCRERRTG